MVTIITTLLGLKVVLPWAMKLYCAWALFYLALLDAHLLLGTRLAQVAVDSTSPSCSAVE